MGYPSTFEEELAQVTAQLRKSEEENARLKNLKGMSVRRAIEIVLATIPVSHYDRDALLRHRNGRAYEDPVPESGKKINRFRLEADLLEVIGHINLHPNFDKKAMLDRAEIARASLRRIISGLKDDA